MLGRIRNSIFTRILCLLLGLYLFNISVDTADPNPEHIPEDLSINDQESIVEIIVEHVLGYEDAIKEYDDRDTEDHGKEKNVKIDFLVHVTTSKRHDQNQVLERNKVNPGYDTRLTKGFSETESPPPKV